MAVPRFCIQSLPFAWLLLAAPGWAAGGEKEHPGAVIYAKQCANCHGDDGQGVDEEYDEPLYGNRSLASLTRLIERTMPEDDEDACVGTDAAQVAAYIYHAFYSPAARAKLHPSRITLTRLTNRQYRESIADLIGERSGKAGTGQGLRAEYFDSKGMNKKNALKLKRIDGRIDFEFGEGPPLEEMNPEQFSIAWQGSIRARETGFYEFRVKTPNGVRLYVNADLKEGDFNYRDDSSADSQRPLIDAWVSSGGKMREESGKVFLLGGRSYPFRLDYFKYKEKTASVRLEWKPPHGAWSVPRGGDFSPEASRRTMVVSAPFPPDDRSLGFERGSAVSKGWFDSVTKAALEVAGEVDERLRASKGKFPELPEGRQKLIALGNEFAERAFRRPLTPEERKRYVESAFHGVQTREQAIKRLVLQVLKSPQFLYPDLPQGKQGENDQRAARLALMLWDSLPDDALLRASREKKLERRDQVQAQARRMLRDPRARAKMQEFFHVWLEMDGEKDLLKDEEAYPGFTDAIIADLRHSLNLFVDGVVWSESSDFRELLTADYLLLNRELAGLYGKKGGGDSFERISFEPRQRSGVLTHPYLLTAFAYPNNSSPIHRGVFLTRNIVGRALKPPPVAVAFKDAEFDPEMTMREKVTELTRDAACMGCHEAINPLGFSLENFDGIGRWRTQENNRRIDPVSQYKTEEGKTIQLKGARDVARYAAGSTAARNAFVAHLFHHLVKQPVDAYGANTLEKLGDGFAKSKFHIQNLMVEIVTVAAMHQSEGKDS